MPHDEKMYAVAVRDGVLFLFLRIRRNAKGEVFAVFPRGEKRWNPHASYHADGTLHQKSYDRKSLARKRPEPTAIAFTETVNLLTTGIAADEPRAINDHCDPAKFSEVFEIPVAELRPEKYRTMISVDLTAPGGEPIITDGARILTQRIFKDRVPWIMVTLFDTAA